MKRSASPLSRFRAFAAAAMLAAGALAAAGARATAQYPTAPYRDWRTLETTHFRFHFPSAYTGWVRETASHMEAVDSAVRALVGFAPTHRVDVVVDNPYDEPNGSAMPLIAAPVLTFWPVPPNPRDVIGNWRSWGEMLSVHEFAHLAHLTRPSRNPGDALLWRLLPAELGPLPRKVPRWAIEGYATFVEGRITGSGRPNGAWRSTVLRQWALEGRLPTYDQMSAWGAFDGGDFAYLAGSAFLEWLVARQGDSSLVHVWRRASARVERSFDEAFAGVYGDTPRVLYGRFTAQLTVDAADARRALAQRGLVEGTLIQHLSWQTGDPAVDVRGTQIAIVLRSATAPSRLVIWSTTPPSPDTAAERRRREMLKRDPEDVPARQFYPPPPRVGATLEAVAGRGFVHPRFVPDDRHVLVDRVTRQSDGSFRPDLYLWDLDDRSVRRVTVNAGVEDADPSPDGHEALGTRCTAGSCQVVRVDLATGTVRPVLRGSPSRSYYHPRYSPGGDQFVVSATDGGRWRLALANLDGSGFRFFGPVDDANRFDATFRDGSGAVVYASDRGGVINLAEFDPATGRERALTRVTGAAVAPAVDPMDRSIWFLSLHAGGYDVRRLANDSAAGEVADIVGEFGDASPPRPAPRPALPLNPVGTARPYGLGPRQTRWLPGVGFGPDGLAASGYITNIDVIGRLDAMAGGSVGARPQWRGSTFGLAWRGSRLEVDAGAHWTRREPRLGSVAGTTAAAFDATRTGGLLAAAWTATGDEWRWRVRAGAGAERLTLGGIPTHVSRTLGFAEWSGTTQQTRGRQGVAERLAVHADAGRTGPDGVTRVVVRAGIGVSGVAAFPVTVGGTWGRMHGSALPVERFAAGGLASPLIDSSLTAARYAVPGLPNGAAVPGSASRTSSLFAYRAGIPMGLLTPFYEAVSVSSGGGPGPWHRLFGLEYSFATGPVPTAFIPGFNFLLGVARSVDAPYRGRTTLYSEFRLTP